MSSLALTALLHVSLLVTGDTSSYNAAYKSMNDTGRPMVVMIGADWCPACQTMKTAVLPQVQKEGGLDKVAYAVVNTDREGPLANKMMSGGMIPQLVVYVKTDSGWKRDVMVGAHSTEEVEQFINKNVAQVPVRLGSR